MTLVRTLAGEFRQLLGREGRHHRVQALAWTQEATQQVMAKDAAHLGAKPKPKAPRAEALKTDLKARALTRLSVQPKGEAGQGQRALATTPQKGEARLANNRVLGATREAIVEALLKALYPAQQKFKVVREAFLRDRHGRIALDAASQESRRIDFVVFQGEEVVRSIEVTSLKVDKAAQLAKEARIRRHGGRYLLAPNQSLVRVPAEVKTTVLRLP